jgi:hypothetical protein
VSPPGAAKINRFEPTPAPFKRRLFLFSSFANDSRHRRVFPQSPRVSARPTRDGSSKARVFSFLPFDASRVLRVTDKLAMLPFGDGI